MTHAIAGAALAVALFASASAHAMASPNVAGISHEYRTDVSNRAEGRQDWRGDWRGPDHRGYGNPQISNDIWRSGSWRHDWHNGKFGWWWAVDDFWFFYPEPIYPYPAYIVEGSLPQANSYFCNSPKGYYPVVRSCDGPWQILPAAPPQ